MNDDMLVRSVAADYVHSGGEDALRYLRECEEIARHRGDDLSAQAWGDIADSAKTILIGFLRERAVQCRRLARGLPEYEPTTHKLSVMADEFESRAKRYTN